MSDVDEKMFLEAETSFGLNFLSTLPANQSIVFSPLSIALALSLVHAGAKGSSRDQIGDVLLKGASDDQFISHFQFISESLKEGVNEVKVNVANRVYLQTGFNPEPSYLSTVQKNYNASAESLDFSTPSAVQKINSFVETSTNGQITEMVTQESIKDAVALLVNAIYFKGRWEDNFASSDTREREFHKDSGEKVNIPFTNEIKYHRDLAQDELFQVLVLRYKDPKYRFAIFLPKVRNGLGEAMKKLDAARFQKLMNSAKSTYLNTAFPLFTADFETPLKDSLTKLGISQIFTDNADLSGIAKKLKISDGAHKAMLKVTEDGTTAAAYTVVKAVPMSMPMNDPIDFQADHPFLYALVRENHPLFLGVFRL